MKQIDHVGVAVRDMDEAIALYTRLCNVGPYYSESVDAQHLDVTFFKLGDTKIELLCPQNENSTVHKFLEKRGPGTHHIAFAVDDIHAEIERMKKEGFQPLSEGPMVGAMKKLVIFFHPRDTGGVLIELCQPQL